MIADNVAFRDELAAAGAKVTADFEPGEHNWAYWDARIQDVLAWLPLRGRGLLTHPTSTLPRRGSCVVQR